MVTIIYNAIFINEINIVKNLNTLTLMRSLYRNIAMMIVLIVCISSCTKTVVSVHALSVTPFRNYYTTTYNAAIKALLPAYDTIGGQFQYKSPQSINDAYSFNTGTAVKNVGDTLHLTTSVSFTDGVSVVDSIQSIKIDCIDNNTSQILKTYSLKISDFKLISSNAYPATIPTTTHVYCNNTMNYILTVFTTIPVELKSRTCDIVYTVSTANGVTTSSIIKAAIRIN